jgi:phosphatidate cytidylyltransferase
MLRTRIVTAVVLISAWVLVFGVLRIPWLMVSVVALFVGVAGLEYAGMRWAEGSGGEELKVPKFSPSHLVLAFSYALPLLLQQFLLDVVGKPVLLLPFLLGLLTLLSLGTAIFLYRRCADLSVVVARWVDAMAGFVYLSFPAMAILRLLVMDSDSVFPGGPFWFALIIVAMGDTGAYFTGVKFGKHKLLPRVSPKKTVEGSVGGLFWSAASAIGFGVWFGFPMPWYVLLAAGILIGAAGQIGDLVESALKRIAGCKDSGWIFPGHGGVLDRIDSFLFAAPLAYALFVYFGVAA